jgi:hypothetical protein
MWKNFVLELHGEGSEFADECIGLLSPVVNYFGLLVIWLFWGRTEFPLMPAAVLTLLEGVC